VNVAQFNLMIVSTMKKTKPEDGDEQIDKHDGCHQNVDKEQRHREPILWTTWNFRIVWGDKTGGIAVLKFSYRHNINICDIILVCGLKAFSNKPMTI